MIHAEGKAVTTGEKLAAYMKEHGFSQRWLSRETGIYMNTITRILRGDKLGNIHTWMAFADAMGCTLDDILYDDSEEE